MNENFNYCHVVGRTDVGRRRPANEDNMLNAITQNGLVSVVCDGMGGHVGGAMASKIAVTTIIEHLSSVYYEDPRLAIGEAIEVANNAILQKTQEQPELNGMGSTCVLLIVRNGKVYIGHVGDSRIYLIRSNTIRQLTKDHSYVQMLVDCGQITQEEAERHPRKNEITNALGLINMTPATIASEPFCPEAGDCFLLCSDGLSGMVSDDKICRVISQQAKMNAQDRVDTLIEMANANGGVDNITVQLVEFAVTPNAVVANKKFPLWAKVTCGVVALLGLGTGAYFGLRGNSSEQTADNIEIQKIDTIEFQEGERFVQFAFVDSTLNIKNSKDSLIHKETRAKIDPNSLYIHTEKLESDNNKSWIAFTNEPPGDSIAFSFKSKEGRLFKYIIYIDETNSSGGKSASSRGDDVDNIIKDFKNDKPDEGTKRPNENGKSNLSPDRIKGSQITSPNPPVQASKKDTIAIEQKCTSANEIVLTYSGETPKLLINGKDVDKENVDKIQKCGRIKSAELANCTETECWKSDKRKNQLKISLKRGKKIENHQVFTIKCKNEDNKVFFISLSLIIKNKE